MTQQDTMAEIRDALMNTGSRTHSSKGLNVYHVYPLNDFREHNTEGFMCWCNPTLDGEMVVHNSMDGREGYENGRKLS
jgi:hypothetical protein